MKYCIVKRDITFSSFTPLILIAVLTVALCVLTMFFFVFIPPLIFLLGVGCIIYLSPRFLKNEYEYSLEGDDFIVSLIMNKASRKELFSSDMEKLISCAPADGDISIGGNVRRIKAYASSGELYCARFSSDNGIVAVLFSPSKEFLNEMRLISPSKIKLK